MIRWRITHHEIWAWRSPAFERRKNGLTMEDVFKFQLGQRLKMNVLDEFGEVYARSEWQHEGRSYLMRYKSRDGKLMNDWFAEGELCCVTD